jgi:division protein CdvB (Snf7/Vps24/ESCRT-III family)
LNPFHFLSQRQEAGLKEKLSVAVKRIDIHRRELEILRGKLEARRQSLFETTVKAFGKKDIDRATVYSNEHAELKRVIHVVTVSELALMQIVVRLESIRDVGDIIYQLNSSFKILRKVSRDVSGLVPAFENATQDVNATLTSTLEGLSQISPNFSLNVKTENEHELVEQAKKYAEEKAMALKGEIPSSILTAKGETLIEKTQKVAVLATGDNAESLDDGDFSPVILSRPKSYNIYDDIYKYVAGKDGQLNILEASTILNLPVDEVEQAVLKLASEGKIRLSNDEYVKQR